MEPRVEVAPVVNWHLWAPCNYRCKFCFVPMTEIPGHLNRSSSLRLVGELRRAGVEKLTFVGGEPTLHPWLDDLLWEARYRGLVTCLVTNGTGITRGFLDRCGDALDWVGLSIDSASEETEAALGRGQGNHVSKALAAAALVKEYSIKLKVNTVVTSLNWGEDMGSLICHLSPQRWKVFQMLVVRGENDAAAPTLQTTPAQFDRFLRRHARLGPVAEDNEAMIASYAMVDPLGRFFQNSPFGYRYSAPILQVGVRAALAQVGWDRAKFIQRGGSYRWGEGRPWVGAQTPRRAPMEG